MSRKSRRRKKRVYKRARRKTLTTRRVSLLDSLFKQPTPVTPRTKIINTLPEIKVIKQKVQQNVYKPIKYKKQTATQQAHHEARVCTKRTVRKQILHALNKTGTGTKRKRPNFTKDSKIKC